MSEMKERIAELINGYEHGEYEGEENWLSAGDVLDGIEEIMDYEWDDELSPKLQDAIREYVLQRHDAERGGGRIPDGSDEFIQKVEEIIGWED